jgi:hypothetical protein
MTKNSLTHFQKQYEEMGLVTFGITIGQKPDGEKSLICPKGWQKLTSTQSLSSRHNGIGVLCGVNNLVVVDLDLLKPKDAPGNISGVEMWNCLCKRYNFKPTFTVKTASGGFHYYFKAENGAEFLDKIVSIPVRLHNGSIVKTKIDLLTKGAFAVGAGSFNPVHNATYEIIGGDKIAPLPFWVDNLLRKGEIIEFAPGEFSIVQKQEVEVEVKSSAPAAPVDSPQPKCDITEEQMTVFLDMIDVFARDYTTWRDVIFSLHNLYGDGQTFQTLAHHFSSGCRSKYDKERVDEYISKVKFPEYGYRWKNLLEMCKKHKLNEAREYLENILNENKGYPAPITVGRFDAATTEGQTLYDTYEYLRELNSRKLSKREYCQLAMPRICQSLCYLVDQRSFVYKTETGLEISKEIPRKYCAFFVQGQDGPVRRVKHLIDILYEYWDSITMFDTMDFYPVGPEETDKSPRKTLNTWRGFKAKLLPRDEICMDKFKLTLEHVSKILCAGDETQLQFFLGGFLAPMFRKPGVKTGVAINLVSRPGCGKGTFIDKFLIPYVFGEHMATAVQGVDKLVQRFNNVIANKLFISVSELPTIDIKARNGQFDMLKSHITDEIITIEIKNGPVMTCRAFARFIFSTNHEMALKIEEGDRRYAVWKCAEDRIGDFDYFAALENEMSCQEAADNFFSYCYHYETKVNPRRAPMTKLKYNMIEAQASSPRRF